ncbi:hypothetical protein O6H91_03G065300 [Diphasiastrum complanatum]|uniref:Uncharacterized protein n=1 Tax=Diphasiastrum complanatum TaxID=34168 RepID=A0ACC2E7G8_DIPCM|nr:hypothetical protein O6H91_03G065300 [Diphasiastrum complanatum]
MQGAVDCLLPTPVELMTAENFELHSSGGSMDTKPQKQGPMERQDEEQIATEGRIKDQEGGRREVLQPRTRTRVAQQQEGGSPVAERGCGAADRICAGNTAGGVTSSKGTRRMDMRVKGKKQRRIREERRATSMARRALHTREEA